jgi:hypothetical protein
MLRIITATVLAIAGIIQFVGGCFGGDFKSALLGFILIGISGFLAQSDEY